MNRQCGIYIITNTVNGKRYVGSSCNIASRWSNHRRYLRHNCHGNAHLQAAWNKYSEKSFTFEVVLLCEVNDLFYYEQLYIDTLKPEYNKAPCAACPGRGHHMSEKHKRIISEAHKGKPLSVEHRRKLSEASKGNKSALGNKGSVGHHYALGCKHTEESKRKQSEHMKGNHYTLGHKLSEERKSKLREANKNYWTEEQKRRFSDAQKGELNHNFGKHHTEEALRKMSEASKRYWAERKANQTQL